MNNNFKRNIFFVSSILLSQITIAQKVNEFSVQQAVDYAKQNAIQVKNALLDIKIQQQVNREITSAAYPQFSGAVSVNHFPNVAVQSFPNFIAQGTYGVLENEGVKDGNGNAIISPNDFGLIQAQFGTKYNASAGFELSQLLFDGQVFVGLQARKTSIDFYRKQVEVSEEMIKVNVQKIYYQLVVGRQQLTSIDANIERFEKLLSDTKEIYKNGFAERLDIDKVNVQLNNLKTEKVKLQNRLEAGNAGLKFLLNMPQKDKLVLIDSLTDDDIKNNILDQAYNYSDRKEIQLLEISQRLNKFNIKRHRLSYLPTVAAYGNYSKNAQRNEFNFFNNGAWFTSSLIGLKISIPIFDGFAKDARVKQAKLAFEKTANNIEQLKASIDREAEQAKLLMTSSIITMDNQRQNVQLAESVYNTTKKKFEQGLGSNQEIYNAQAELKVAQTNYYSSLYDAIIARIDYLTATGKL
jgi:outer membrane protein TolC